MKKGKGRIRGKRRQELKFRDEVSKQRRIR
jgi:hypothetical protein